MTTRIVELRAEKLVQQHIQPRRVVAYQKQRGPVPHGESKWRQSSERTLKACRWWGLLDRSFRAGGGKLAILLPNLLPPTRLREHQRRSRGLLDRSFRAGGGKSAISLPDLLPPNFLLLRLVFQIHSGFNLTEF
jgi:hypothetical protein